MKTAQTMIVPIANFCLAIGIFIIIIQSANAQTSCDTYASESIFPQGFGAAWNVLTAAKELLLKSECNQTSVKITAGSGGNNKFIYKTGYYYKDGWQPFTFQGTAAINTNDWLVGQGTYALNNLPSDTLSWVAYVCQWDSGGNKWKCGCSDAACANSYWQLQKIKLPVTPQQPTNTPTAKCPGNASTACGPDLICNATQYCYAAIPGVPNGQPHYSCVQAPSPCPLTCANIPYSRMGCGCQELNGSVTVTCYAP